MPKISGARPIATPSTELEFPERVDIPSPDGEWKVVFHSSREFQMSADGWQVKLFHRGQDVTKEHRDFFRIAEGKGFRWEPDFRLWSFDSKLVVMVTWDEKPIHLYEVATKRNKHLYDQRVVRSPQWAPDMDRLLLTSWTEGFLVDQTGTQHAVVRWGIAEGESPYTDWLNTGKCFFLLARPDRASKTQITFYSGVDGTLKDAHDLDPSDLVPYNAEDYAELSRNKLSLVSADQGFLTVGSLLDTWSGVKFDQASNTLFLGVFRPVSAPYRQEGELVCKAKQVWVTVELDLT